MPLVLAGEIILSSTLFIGANFNDGTQEMNTVLDFDGSSINRGIPPLIWRHNAGFNNS